MWLQLESFECSWDTQVSVGGKYFIYPIKYKSYVFSVLISQRKREYRCLFNINITISVWKVHSSFARLYNAYNSIWTLYQYVYGIITGIDGPGSHKHIPPQYQDGV